ncbi:MAG TPA: hypothetical protein VFF40_00300 [Acidimicrobiia bacterium]|nr:hypothetical protein [Acidimicrobiia bacterium]
MLAQQGWVGSVPDPGDPETALAFVLAATGRRDGAGLAHAPPNLYA